MWELRRPESSVEQFLSTMQVRQNPSEANSLVVVVESQVRSNIHTSCARGLIPAVRGWSLTELVSSSAVLRPFSQRIPVKVSPTTAYPSGSVSRCRPPFSPRAGMLKHSPVAVCTSTLKPRCTMSLVVGEGDLFGDGPRISTPRTRLCVSSNACVSSARQRAVCNQKCEISRTQLEAQYMPMGTPALICKLCDLHISILSGLRSVNSNQNAASQIWPRLPHP